MSIWRKKNTKYYLLLLQNLLLSAIFDPANPRLGSRANLNMCAYCGVSCCSTSKLGYLGWQIETVLRVFQSSDGKDRGQSKDLLVTFCIITEPLLPLDYIASPSRSPKHGNNKRRKTPRADSTVHNSFSFRLLES